MELKTHVKIKSFPFEISHHDTFFSMGSCFSDEMGKRLQQSKFCIENNPFGVLFQPISIENALDRVLSLTEYESYEIFRYNELYFSWDHSSIFGAITQKDCLDKVNHRLAIANETIQNTSVFIITLATSWAYYLKKAKIFVANCHKVPGKEFDKILLSENEIEESLKRMIEKINDLPQKPKIIFTVSPVRHLRDGLVENSVSKSRLLNAVYKMTKKFDHVFYFPSYEILLDELRDYRFFAEDMIHPSKQAIDYIWQRFGDSFFSESTKKLVNKTQEINKTLNHKPLHTETLAFKKFIYYSIKQMEEIEKEFGFEAFKTEKKNLNLKPKNAD